MLGKRPIAPDVWAVSYNVTGHVTLKNNPFDVFQERRKEAERILREREELRRQQEQLRYEQEKRNHLKRGREMEHGYECKESVVQLHPSHISTCCRSLWIETCCVFDGLDEEMIPTGTATRRSSRSPTSECIKAATTVGSSGFPVSIPERGAAFQQPRRSSPTRMTGK